LIWHGRSQILTAAWDTFHARYQKFHRPALRPLRPNVFTAVRNFLRCGDLTSGFLLAPPRLNNPPATCAGKTRDGKTQDAKHEFACAIARL
jgi:hypothetical protein